MATARDSSPESMETAREPSVSSVASQESKNNAMTNALPSSVSNNMMQLAVSPTDYSGMTSSVPPDIITLSAVPRTSFNSMIQSTAPLAHCDDMGTSVMPPARHGDMMTSAMPPTLPVPMSSVEVLNLALPPTPSDAESIGDQYVGEEGTQDGSNSLGFDNDSPMQHMNMLGNVCASVASILTPENSPLDGTRVLQKDQINHESEGQHRMIKVQQLVPSTEVMDGSSQNMNETAQKTGNISQKKGKAVTKALKFPPCFVCGGNASGLHYGVNSCEACKGFFRRRLLRQEDYKCTKGGNCEIINRNRGNCAGCRLKKCLELGMSKDKSKLGRYTLSQRTETIKKVNILEGKEEGEAVKESVYKSASHTSQRPKEAFDFDPQSEIISRKMSATSPDIIVEETFSEKLIKTLVVAMENIRPYGPDIVTIEQIQAALKCHYDQYMEKIKLYGEMKSVSKEDFYKLYKGYGIDIDGRVDCLRQSVKGIEDMIERYCNFAKHIPDFLKLTCRDQSNLLKSARCDFFVILMNECYSQEYQVLLSNNGHAYHVEEAADKFMSRELINSICDMYRRWQQLNLTQSEKALIIALTLVFTDRCNLDNHDMVEKIQFSLTELLLTQLEKGCKSSARQRFTKIIDYLTLMRESSEMYLKEYKLLCKDEVVIEEVPMMTEFLLEDW